MALDDAAVRAAKDPIQDGSQPVRPRPATFPPTAEADLRLIRTQVDQQSQLLAAMHQLMVTGQQVVETNLSRFHEELAAQSDKIDRITEMLEAINKQLEVR